MVERQGRLSFVRNRDVWVLALLIAGYVALHGGLSAVKYRWYLYDDIDLAIFTQALERLLAGSLFSSIRGMNWLGDHSSLVLFLLAPIFAVARHPLTLLAVQTLALGLGAIPVYRLARREIGAGFPALGWAALYLAYPALGYLNLFEFHPEALSTPALLAAFDAVRARRLRPALVFSGLALLGKEDVALVIAVLGLYSLRAARPRGRSFAAALVGLATASLVVSFAILKPMWGGAEADYARMYGAFGSTPLEVARSLIFDPWRALRAFVADPMTGALDPAKLQLWLHYLVPVLGLALMSPLAVAIALPVLAEHLLSFRPQQHTIVNQYGALVIPFVFMAAVLGCRNLLARAAGDMRFKDLPERLAADPGLRRMGMVVIGLAMVATALSHLAFGPIIGQRVLQDLGPSQRHWPTPADRRAAADRDRMIARIPPQGAIVADFPMLARLARRPELHSIHHVMSGTSTFSAQPYPTPRHVVAVVADVAHDRLRPYLDAGTGARLRALVAGSRIRPVEASGDLILGLADADRPLLLTVTGTFRPHTIAIAAFDRQLMLYGADLPAAPVQPGGWLAVRTVWRRLHPTPEPCIVQWLVLDGRGAVLDERLHVLGYAIHPPGDWAVPGDVRETYALPVPASWSAGRYTLALRVAWKRGGRMELAGVERPGTAMVRGERCELGAFTVGPPPLAGSP